MGLQRVGHDLATEQQEMKRVGTFTKNKMLPTEIQFVIIYLESH